MSSQNNKTDIHKNMAGKKRRHEEQMDEEMQSPERKPTHHKSQKSSEKKKKRKQSESNSSAVKDEEMEDVEEVENEEGSDDDDDEDDDEYDDEDGESMEGFIVDDEEALEDEEQEEQEDAPDEVKHKKKKRRRAERKLEQEDLDLLQENLGVDVQKRKRLQKVSEVERNQEILERQNKQADQQQLQNENDQKDEEEEQIDTTRRRKFVGQRKRDLFDSSYQQYVDPDRANTAKQIFDDPLSLAQRVQSIRKGVEEEKRAEKDNLDEYFDGDEIDDQFATKQDKIIAERDIPERLQIKIAEYKYFFNLIHINRRLAFNFPGDYDDDIKQEIEFIYNRLVDITKREDLLQYEEQVKRKIKNIINYLRKDYLDVPMIAKYRKYDYMKELDENDVWQIFNLDLEYGKFQQQKQQMLNFIQKISQIDSNLDIYAADIDKTRNLQELQNYSPLIGFMKQYYFEELQQLPEEQRKKMPFKLDQVATLKKNQYDVYAKQIFLDPVYFIENLINNELTQKPPKTQDFLKNLLQQYDESGSQINVLQQILKFAAIQLSVQPYLRAMMKKHFYNTGYLTTNPTETGKKVLDVFHPSYQIKRINKEPLMNFMNDDKFLDIIENEKRELIEVIIEISEDGMKQFQHNLYEKYIPYDHPDLEKKVYTEMLNVLLTEHLVPDIRKEIKIELAEQAENFIIKRCQEQYRNLLMTGPFSCEELTKRGGEERVYQRGSRNREEDNIIQERPRCTVMGVILQQLDSNTNIVTVAIVDKYGELVTHKDFSHLIPPRQFKPKQAQNDEEEQRQKKAKMSYNEEKREHDADQDQIKELIYKHQVDLIVVGANRLEARQIKEVFRNIAENMKNYGGREEEETKRGSKKRQRGDSEEIKREAFVIWGSLEVPKLFANCHQSTKLLKNSHTILKQAVCLARFEQDPMIEILNLWSFVPADNQALQLNLHFMQKQINQAKLADALEEVNIQCVNAVGVDLNLIIDHDHMNVLLSFISGIGPRKAKKFIQNLKQHGKKITTRGEIYRHNFLEKTCHLSAIAFLKIRIPPEEAEEKQQYDILDQTRIHPESNMLAHKVAKDIIYEGQEVDQYHSYQAVKEVIKNPQKLTELDLKLYKQELENSQQTNMIILLDYIIEELRSPFKDPRTYRKPSRLQITNAQLFYMLIDETERSFRRGQIYTATVVRVSDNIVYCKLENGLDAIVSKNDLEKTDDKLQDIIQPGQVITGRIHEIRDKEEMRFGVTLNCKRKALETHKDYVDSKITVPEEDLVNSAFQIDKKVQQTGRYVSRRINHLKFKNIPSNRAIAELQDKEVGEYIFRPSSKGPNNLTLTWKFYTNNIVHIDIEELEKPVGANIGSKLKIGEEIFENLQEIVERYILPCNRLLREACSNQKFKQCEDQAELEKVLKDEKQADPTKIPYRLTVLNQYPQYIVLGYIPKMALVKEYIKVKPRGYYFHEKMHHPIQNLINWFKQNQRTKEYNKLMKRQRSPRARTQVEAQQQNIDNRQRPSQQNAEQQREWGGISQDWQRPSGANSIHSANEDHQDYQSNRYQEHGGNTRGGFQGGYSDNNYNQKMDSNENRGRGGNRGCFTCGEQGHMSRDCPNKDQRKPMGRGRGRGADDGGRGSHRKYENDETSKWDNEEPGNTWGGGNQGANSPQQNQAWGNNETAGAPKSPKWGQQENASMQVDQQQTSGGWGSKTPQRTDNFSGGGWGDNNNEQAGWGNQGGDNNYDKRSSPARSQRSQEDSGRGRGRGRGRGGDQNRGGGGRSCFKCNQEGHMAKDCPNPDQRQDRGRGGGGKSCFKCNQEGHFARECPNADQRSDRGDRGGDRGRGRGRGRGGGGDRPRECYKCNQEGHFARECPNEGNNEGGRPYKRQKREDGGSVRRDEGGGNEWNNEGDNNWNKSGGDDGWNKQSDNNEGGNAWGNSSAWGDNNQKKQTYEDQWGNPDANNQGGWQN